jgi:flagellar hook-basal body complex protein FliE
MAISPVAAYGTAFSPAKVESSSASASSGGSFPRALDQLLNSAAQSHDAAESAVRDLAVGQTDNLHGVMLQMAQADLTFRLVLEVRNRLTEAYQEIMKMQV